MIMGCWAPTGWPGYEPRGPVGTGHPKRDRARLWLNYKMPRTSPVVKFSG